VVVRADASSPLAVGQVFRVVARTGTVAIFILQRRRYVAAADGRRRECGRRVETDLHRLAGADWSAYRKEPEQCTSLQEGKSFLFSPINCSVVNW
jgi:hypothetical protein